MIFDVFPVIPDGVLRLAGPLVAGFAVIFLTLCVLLVVVKNEQWHDKIAKGLIACAGVLLLAFFSLFVFGSVYFPYQAVKCFRAGNFVFTAIFSILSLFMFSGLIQMIRAFRKDVGKILSDFLLHRFSWSLKPNNPKMGDTLNISVAMKPKEQINFGSLKMILRCEKFHSTKTERGQGEILYSDEKEIGTNVIFAETRKVIDVFFKLPADGPASSMDGDWIVDWRIDLIGKINGKPDFERSYEFEIVK